jgi:hypothetical protein
MNRSIRNSYKTLICLVSEQRMQNIIPLYQRGMAIRRLVFIASLEGNTISKRFTKISHEIQKALAERVECILHPEGVDPMSSEKMKDICHSILKSYGGSDHVAINFTGGTKPMSIGAYLAGQEAEAGLIYVDTQAERIYHYDKDQLWFEPFDLKPIMIADLLNIHGRYLAKNQLTSSRLTAEELHLARLIRERCPASFLALKYLCEWLNSINFVRDQMRALPSALYSKMPWFIQALGDVGFATKHTRTWYLNPSVRPFVSGKWLEGFTYLAALEGGNFSDVEHSLKIEGVENEIDVACVLNGKLGIVECKTGRLKGTAGQSALNRLWALKDGLGGTFARSFLVINKPVEQMAKAFRQRAQAYGISVIGLGELEQVDHLIAQKLGTKRL